MADCRSSGLSVTRWCTEHSIKPKTYYQRLAVVPNRAGDGANRRKDSGPDAGKLGDPLLGAVSEPVGRQVAFGAS